MLITLATPPAQAGALEIETVSAELTCTNRQLPSTLRVGDVQLTTDSSPEFARFRNVTRPTMSVPPPLGGSVYWRLLSHMSLNYRSIGSVDMLRNALELYNFRALVDRQAAQAHKRLLDAIKSISTQAKTLLHRGAPVRGVAIALELDEAGFSGEGDLYVFAAVLNEFFASYVTVNAFSQLTVTGSRYKEVHAWPLKLGGKSSL
ncbi:MAG: type VI secretion system baseplate subunit TssF [Planctomycetota bacterium]